MQLSVLLHMLLTYVNSLANSAHNKVSSVILSQAVIYSYYIATGCTATVSKGTLFYRYLV